MRTQSVEPSTQLRQQLLSWQPDLIGTLVYLQRDNPKTQQPEVLLIHKRSGHGQGLINGPGGKLEPTETVYQCAHRELLEEVGVSAQRLMLRARIRFVDLQGPQWLGFVFTATSFAGTPTATLEAIPAWHPIREVPWDQMWPSDRLWLPKVLAAEQVDANLLFTAGELQHQQVLTYPAA